MAGSIATALTVLTWNRRTDFHHAVLSENIRSSSGAWNAYQSQLGDRGVGGMNALQYVDHVISSQATTLGVNDLFHVLAGMCLLLIPFVWFARPPFRAGGAGAAH